MKVLIALVLFLSSLVGMSHGAFAEDEKIAFTQRDLTVRMLAKGGKYNILTTAENFMKGDFTVSRTEEGDVCTVPKGILVVKSGESSGPDMVRVRLIYPGLSAGACSLMTPFEMTTEEFVAGVQAWNTHVNQK